MCVWLGGIDCGRGECVSFGSFLLSCCFHASSVLIGVLGFWGAVRALFQLRRAALGDDLKEGVTLLVRL